MKASLFSSYQVFISDSSLSKSNSFLNALGFIEKDNSNYKLTNLGLDYISKVEHDDKEANKLLKRRYRKPYEIPETV